MTRDLLAFWFTTLWIVITGANVYGMVVDNNVTSAFAVGYTTALVLNWFIWSRI